MLSGNQSPGSVVSGDTAALFTLPFGNILPRWAAPVPEAFEFLLTEFPGTARRRAVTGAVLHTVTGASIANGGVWVGDLNADGSPDYLTGGDSYPASVPLHVISGIDTVNGTAASRTLRTFSDPVTPGLGYAEDNNNIAAAIGDISGDGVTEIAVGSRLYRIDPDGTNYGRVVVFNGSTGAVLYRLEPDQTHTNGVYFGNNIVAIPDVNADGFDDFVVSARGYGQGGFGAGALIAYSAIDGTELFRVYGNPGEGIGDYEVVSLEDLNGDALPDLAVGSLTQASIWLSRRLVSPANTAVGTGVSVTPSVTNGVTGSVSLVFDNVVTAGETTATASSQGQPPPAGFKLTSPPVYYEIETTAEFTGNVRVCLAWTDGQVANENYVHIFHREGDQWVNITDPGSLDTASNRVCGTATSLSPFAMFEVKYQFTGFYAPVDNPPVVNVVKAGSSIPVKFSLGGALGLSIFASGYPRTVLIQCATGAPMDVIEETSTAGASGLSYNSSTGQYQYNWKTDKAWDGSCRQLQLQFNDGEVSTANFSMSR
jgi:hypothetical protein